MRRIIQYRIKIKKLRFFDKTIIKNINNSIKVSF